VREIMHEALTLDELAHDFSSLLLSAQKSDIGQRSRRYSSSWLLAEINVIVDLRVQPLFFGRVVSGVVSSV